MPNNAGFPAYRSEILRSHIDGYEHQPREKPRNLTAHSLQIAGRYAALATPGLAVAERNEKGGSP